MSISALYCYIADCFPDECVGATDSEMEQEIFKAYKHMRSQLAEAWKENKRLAAELQEIRNLNGELLMERESLGRKNGTIRGV